MTRSVAAVAFLFLAMGCDGSAPSLEDAGCGMPGVPVDQPVLACPAEIDLGCLEESGAAVDVEASVATCDGSEAVVTCTPDRVRPGDATGTGTCSAVSASGASSECTFAIRFAVEGSPGLVCEEVMTLACTGALTESSPPTPLVMSSCTGGSVSAPLSDAPAEGFPVGSTTVRWSATDPSGISYTCSTRVEVTDEQPPVLTCTPQTVIRTGPNVPVELSTPTATDACDPSVDVHVPDVPQIRGVHVLGITAMDDAGGVAACDVELRVLDVFAPRDVVVRSAELVADGTTDVTLGWQDGGGADVTHVRIDRATGPDGPWTELAMIAASASTSASTFTDADAVAPVAYYRIVALAGDIEGGVSDVVGAYALASDEYHLRDQTVPDVRFRTSLYGVVRHPMDLSMGPFPLVLLMHGNHGNCRPSGGGDDECETRQGHDCEDPSFTTTPNAHGYVYLQETLAAQGYVTVSVSANALNCREGFLAERTQLILEHLRRWTIWNGAGAAPFGATFSGVLDLSRVALVGHSRGGEAVATAPAALRATPVAGVSLAGVFGIGPTDYETPTPTGVPFAVLLPGCDADVTTLEGLRQYDRGLDPSDSNPRAQVLYVGANHNFFNTEWRFDDNETLSRACSDSEQVGGAAQRGMLEVVLSDWIRSTMTGASPPAYQRGETDTHASVDHWADRALDLRWSYAAPSRLVIDDFEGAGSPDRNDLGGGNTYSGMIASITCEGRCARNFSHQVAAVRPAWRDEPALMSFSIGEVDASAWAALSMRFASRLATINDGITEHEFGVMVSDTAGRSAQVTLSAVGRLPHGYDSRFEQEVLTTVRVPLASFQAVEPRIDLEHLVAVEVGMPVAAGNAAGSVWMSDLEFAGY